MIESIRGRLLELHQDGLTVEVGGLGVRLQVPSRVIERMGSLRDGTADTPLVRLATHLLVRPDGWQLFGFQGQDERKLFRILLGIPGVGPRLAMGVLSHLTLEEIRTAVASRDARGFVGVPGVGKRTAARIVLELTGKLDEEVHEPAATAESRPTRDAVDALIALGLGRTEALALVRAVAQPKEETQDSSALVAAALRLRQERT